MNQLQEKRILITGASSGIGRAIAQEAALLGAKLILFGRDLERLEETFNSLTGGNHEYYTLDITDYNRVEEVINQTVSANGVIDGFVHSAGIEKIVPLKSSYNSLFKSVFEVNVFAGFEISRLLSRKGYFSKNGASFVFISSVNAVKGDACKTIYCSSKSALLSGVKAMAKELAGKKIRCNCVLPGIVETPMVKKMFGTLSEDAKEAIVSKHPLGLGKPEDIANLVCFLLSEKASWITGSDYIIDGGYSC